MLESRVAATMGETSTLRQAGGDMDEELVEIGGKVLSLRDLVMLREAVNGSTHRAIGLLVGLSKRGVDHEFSNEQRRHSLYAKLGVQSPNEAIAWCIRHEREVERAIRLYEQSTADSSPIEYISLRDQLHVLNSLDFSHENVHETGANLHEEQRLSKYGSWLRSLLGDDVIALAASPSDLVPYSEWLVEAIFSLELQGQAQNAAMLALLGLPLLKKGRRKARPAIRDALRKTHTRVLFELSGAGWYFVLPNDMLRITENITKQMTEVAGNDPEARGLTLFNLGSGDYAAGLYAKAVPLLKQARNLLERPDDRLHAGRTLALSFAYLGHRYTREFQTLEKELTSDIRQGKFLRLETVCTVYEGLGRGRALLQLPKPFVYLEESQRAHQDIVAGNRSVPARALQRGRSWLDAAILTRQDSAFIEHVAKQVVELARQMGYLRYEDLVDRSLTDIHTKNQKK